MLLSFNFSLDGSLFHFIYPYVSNTHPSECHKHGRYSINTWDLTGCTHWVQFLGWRTMVNGKQKLEKTTLPAS